MLNSTVFVCQLSEEKQNKIVELVTAHFKEKGYNDDEIAQINESVLENRLWNVEDIIDIKPFLK